MPQILMEDQLFSPAMLQESISGGQTWAHRAALYMAIHFDIPLVEGKGELYPTARDNFSGRNKKSAPGG